jgi:UDP-galactopyranose mutase
MNTQTNARPPGQQPVTVVGAGIAGLSAALLLARSGQRVTLYEASQQAGGLLAPIMHDGLPLDRGSHRVHPDAHPLLVELTHEARWQSKQRSGTLILNGRHLGYPLDPIQFVLGLGLSTTLTMGIGWLKRPQALKRAMRWESDRRQVDHDEGFESFVVKRVGRAAYERFYEPYARKVWGIEPCDLSQTVAKQRVSTSNPASSILRKTERRFLYPEQGMASLIDLLREKVESAGVQLVTGEHRVPSAGNNGPVFHTGHLSDIAPNCSLTHRGLYLVHLTVPEDSLGPTDTWYAPETKYWFGRVSQPAQFSDALAQPGRRVLCVEIPEGQWGPDQDFSQQTGLLMDQLHEARILKRPIEPLAFQQTFLPRVYPMFVRGWVEEQRRALEEVAQQGPIFPCGRQGLFLHCNMDQAVATSAAAVEHWLAGRDAKSWTQRCQGFADFRVRD